MKGTKTLLSYLIFLIGLQWKTVYALLPPTCKEEEFMCLNEKQCIHAKWKCNGDDDCGDNSDEENCPEKKTCASDQFQCDNGDCIYIKWYCDKNNDCGDGSDEVDCNLGTCSEHQFQCQTSGHCIFSDYQCDGDPDCIDGSDEKDCLKETTQATGEPVVNKAMKVNERNTTGTIVTTTSASCLSHQFQCTKSGKCLHKSWICDGESDCPNGEDETEALCLVNTCSEDQFTCSNGQCIEMRAKCDGTVHCADGSDEKECSGHVEGVTCSAGTFQCVNSTKCIDFTMVCNGVKNCPEGDDEDPRCGINECEEPGKNRCDHYCTDKDIGYECKCKLGYQLGEDGKTCLAVNECEEYGACSQKCVDTKGSFLCYCNEGYKLGSNKRTCKAGAPEPFLVFSNRFDVRQISTSGMEYKPIAETRHSVAVALDVTNGMIYWSDLKKRTINRIQQNSSSHHGNHSMSSEVVVKELHKPEALAIDWIGRKLYWVDTGSNTISVANLDGSYKKTIVKGTEGHELRTLAVYPEKGYIFWSVWGVKGRIERADLSGNNPTTILDDNQVQSVISIAVDHTLERIFWTDMKTRRICSSNIHGLDRKEILSKLKSPYGIAVFEDYVYWTDYFLKKLFRANKFNGKNMKEFTNSLVQPMSISVYHPLAQTKLPHPHLCEKSNGGCSHLCFINTSSNRTACVCPDGFRTSPEDPKTCIPSCHYRCHVSTKCISKTQVCDSKYDCPEQDDERGCKVAHDRQNTTKTNHNTRNKNLLIIFVPSAVLVVVLIIVVALLKWYRRHQGKMSMVYETDVRSGDKPEDEKCAVTIKFVSKSAKKGRKVGDKKKKRFNEEDPRSPLPILNMYGGDCAFDERFDDDQTPILMDA